MALHSSPRACAFATTAHLPRACSCELYRCAAGAWCVKTQPHTSRQISLTSREETARRTASLPLASRASSLQSEMADGRRRVAPFRMAKLIAAAERRRLWGDRVGRFGRRGGLSWHREKRGVEKTWKGTWQ